MKDKNLLRHLKGEWQEGFISFTSNDYLALSRNEEVIEAGSAAAELYGAGATASRLAGGNHPLYEELEIKLAAIKNAESALVFGSGYLTNIGVIPALAGEGSVIYADKLVHSCIIDGIKLSGAKLIRYNHNDMADLKRRIIPAGGQPVFITEEIFSMDGDKAPLEELRRIVAETGGLLLIDGAHSLYQKTQTSRFENEIYIGTLSKAVGCYGGYVAASKTIIEYLKNKARSFIYSTGLPPFVIGSAIKALELIENGRPYLKTMENAQYLSSLLKLPIPQSAIIPIIMGEEGKALNAETALKANKLLVSAIRPPTVPPGTSRLRISVTAAHTKSQIDFLANSLKEVI